MTRPRPRKTAPPRPYHHGDLPAVLRREALAVIREVGPSAFTLREVARRAGVSHAAPYRHFADKKALLTALAAEGSRQLAERVEAALAEAGPELRPRFLAAGYAYVRFALDRPAHFQVMFAREDIDVNDPEVHAAREASHGILLRFIREGQSLGRLVAGAPEVLAIPIWAMHHGLATLAAAGAFVPKDPGEAARAPDPGALRALVDGAHEALLDGLFVPPRGRTRGA